MTREEAVEIIVREEFYNTDASVWEKMPEVKQAIDMAIEALQENESLARSVNEASELLRKKRPRGEWIYHAEWYSDGECAFECSKCGMGVDIDYNFCPNCGADMRKKGDAE